MHLSSGLSWSIIVVCMVPSLLTGIIPPAIQAADDLRVLPLETDDEPQQPNWQPAFLQAANGKWSAN